MKNVEELAVDVYGRVQGLRKEKKYEKCQNCDCYILLMFYLKEEFSKRAGEDNKEILENVSTTFEKRNEIDMHQCLGCEPCPPAEWTTDLIKKSKK